MILEKSKPIPKPSFTSFFNTCSPVSDALRRAMHPPAEKSIGVQLLMKMGWRPGQGVGPRVSLKERKAQDAAAFDPTTGARLLGDALDIPEDDEEAKKHTYPRRDTPVLRVKRKDNFHGLGYVPGLTLDEQLGQAAQDANQGPQLAGGLKYDLTGFAFTFFFSPGGFGLGALNDADDDDLDVYDPDLNSQKLRKRVAYDHTIDNDTFTIGKKGERRPVAPVSSPSNALRMCEYLEGNLSETFDQHNAVFS